METTIEPIARLTKDIREAAKNLTDDEARFLVDLYYQIQDFRIGAASQVRSMEKTQEPVFVLTWSRDTMETIEKEIRFWLKKYAERKPLGEWAMNICGIGPVLAAGLMAHIDITKAPTVGHIWRFAGLDPTSKWEKKTKRPYNAALKVLCWKIGESFVKVSGNEADIYGKIYLQRKALEIQKNDAGEYAAQAATALQTKNYGKTTEAYKHYITGKLPPGHIHARAKRYAVKLFLSHYHAEAYRLHFGKEPPLPYPIAHLGHVHLV